MKQVKYVFALLSSLLVHGETVTVNVDFKLTELEKMDHPLAGVPVRLVLGEGPDWQGPNAGYRFVTDTNGAGRFSAAGIVDRRWRLEPYAMTGLSFPKRADHMMIALELEQLVPTPGGQYNHFQWLHTLHIDCYPGQCATTDIGAIFTRDAQGRFTRAGQPAGMNNAGYKMPELGEMILGGPGYKTADFFLRPDENDPSRNHWNLRLVVQRRPAPVLR